jgi:hypothetical protein
MFIIQKRERISPDEGSWTTSRILSRFLATQPSILVRPLAVYFIMNNRIYQSPDLYTVLSNRLVSSFHCSGCITLITCTAHISLFLTILARHPATPPTRLHPSNRLCMADNRLLHARRKHQKAKARGRHLHCRRRRNILRLLETSTYGLRVLLRSAQTTAEQYAPPERHAYYSGTYEKADSLSSGCGECTGIRCAACVPATTYVCDPSSVFVEGCHTQSTADGARTAGACKRARRRW